VRAEETLKDEATKNPANLASQLIQGLNKEEAVAGVSSLSCVLLKKYFLDARATSTLAASDLEQLRDAVHSSIDFDAQPL